MAWALGLRALKPQPQEPGDIIIRESNGLQPSSTIIAGETLGEALEGGRNAMGSAELSLESDGLTALKAADEQGTLTQE